MKNSTYTMSDFDKITKETLAELPDLEKELVATIFALAKVKLELMMVKRSLPADMDED
jgi:hypothetical protein